MGKSRTRPRRRLPYGCILRHSARARGHQAGVGCVARLWGTSKGARAAPGAGLEGAREPSTGQREGRCPDGAHRQESGPQQQQQQQQAQAASAFP